MTSSNTIIQVPARKAGTRIPGVLAVGQAVIEVAAERTPNGGTHAKRFSARWTKGTWQGDAFIDIRPASKASTEITVTLERPDGPLGILWLRASRRRLGELFARALAYEIETRNVEEASAFGVRRTSRDLVKARAS